VRRASPPRSRRRCPTIHPTLALGCQHRWDADQACFAPQLDIWGETSETGVFVAGDGAGIGGVAAACLPPARSQPCGLPPESVDSQDSDAAAAAQPLWSRLKRALAIRPFLDVLYRPAICCLRAGGRDDCMPLRRSQRGSDPGAGRGAPAAGTKPGQGFHARRNGGRVRVGNAAYTIAHVLAAAEGRTVPDVGLFRVRPPIKPITLDELAALDTVDADS